MDFVQDIVGRTGQLLQELVTKLGQAIDLEVAWASLEQVLPAEAANGLADMWPLILVVLGIFIIVKLFELPLKLIWNGLIGAGTLFLVNIVGSLVGFTMKITLWKALVAGFLGLPGTLAVIIYEIFG